MARWQPDRGDVLAEYAREILGVFPRGRILVGIDGVDGSGKTRFAQDLVTAFADLGVASAAVSMDGFLNEPAVRHQPPDDDRTWYAHAFDYPAFRSSVIDPYRRAEQVTLELRAPADGSPIADPRTWSPPDRAVLVVEGVFLLRPELRGLWHTTALLDVDLDVAFQRCVDRDGWDPADDAMLNRVFFGAQRRYRHDVQPRKVANATFDLTDPAHPRRVFADSC